MSEFTSEDKKLIAETEEFMRISIQICRACCGDGTVDGVRCWLCMGEGVMRFRKILVKSPDNIIMESYECLNLTRRKSSV